MFGQKWLLFFFVRTLSGLSCYRQSVLYFAALLNSSWTIHILKSMCLCHRFWTLVTSKFSRKWNNPLIEIYFKIFKLNLHTFFTHSFTIWYEIVFHFSYKIWFVFLRLPKCLFSPKWSVFITFILVLFFFIVVALVVVDVASRVEKWLQLTSLLAAIKRFVVQFQKERRFFCQACSLLTLFLNFSHWQ